MSIHLVGGGHPSEHSLRVYGPFAAEALQNARAEGRSSARTAVVVLYEGRRTEGAVRFQAFADTLIKLGYNVPEPILLPEGDVLASGQLEDYDALLVSGGLTPAYLDAVLPVRREIQSMVARGGPYLGYSAGAMVAARRAIIGGWKLGDLVMCPEENGEELDELTVADGLGLVDFSVDAHAAQWGNVTRALLAVESGRTDRAVALDEGTVLVVGSSAPVVQGAGQAWWVDRSGDAVTVRTQREPAPELVAP